MKLRLIRNGCIYQNNVYFSNRRLRNFYNTWALRKCVNLVVPDKAKTVLDAGCADGILIPTLAHYFGRVYAADESEFFLGYVRRYCLPNVTTAKTNVEDLDLEDSFFDVIFCSEVLEHVKKPEKALKELNRVLKPGGTLVISVPIEIGPPLLLKVLFRALKISNCADRYTLKELIASIAKRPQNIGVDVGAGVNIEKPEGSHKNFDYRPLINTLKEAFKCVRLHYFPINALGENLNLRVFVVAEKD